MSIAFVVDGVLEKRALQKLCGHVPIRTTGLNGKNVTIKAIADRVEVLLRLLKGRYFPVFIIIDREQRPAPSLTIENLIKNELINKGFCSRDFVVSCPDQMIENWIIAGSSTWNGQQLTFAAGQSFPDGCNGKSVLKKALCALNVSYGETTIGVEMLCCTDFAHAASQSPSFDRLYGQILPYCPKLQNKILEEETITP